MTNSIPQVSRDELVDELLGGGFHEMSRDDLSAFCDASPGTLIAEIRRRGLDFTVLFDAGLGEFEIYNSVASVCWRMRASTGETVQL